jgi:hypothetical protein
MIILGANGQTVINTIQHAITCFNNIKTAIEDMGVTVGSTDADGYPDLIRSIQGDAAAYIGYLNDIYLAIVSRGGVCTEGDYSTYDDGVHSITCNDTVLELKGYLTDISNAILIRGGVFDPSDYSTYDTGILSINTSSSIAQLQNQVAQLQAQVAQYESDFADIATAITAKGGTVSDPDAYDDYDTYIASIPSGSSSHEQELQGYLDDVYGVLSNNTVDVAVTQTPANYDTYISDIYTAYNNTISTKDATITARNATISAYEADFSDIATAITNKGGTVTNPSAYDDYDTYVDSIPSGSGSSYEQELEGYLNDVYTVLAANTVGVTVTQSYDNYDTYISSIYSAYDSTISAKDATITARNATITAYESDFDDIATAITNKGGTVTSATAYSDFDTYIDSIPNTVVQGGKLDSIKSQIAGIEAKEQNARSINENFGNVPLIRVTDGSGLFANMPSFANGNVYSDIYLDMSACTDCTDMFKNSPNVPVMTILNFGNKSNADLVLDLAVRDDFDLSSMADDIIEYTTSPDGTKHVRKFLLTQAAYDSNNDDGVIETLSNKGITVEVKQSS